MTPRACAIIVCLSLPAATFAEAPDAPAATQPATQPAYEGVLQGGMMGIGGETTGWVLRMEGKSMEVDVKAVADDAAKLDGQRVRIAGRIIVKDYVERGPTPILVAESIRPAKQ